MDNIGLTINEPDTFQMDITYINPDLIEMIVGKWHFGIMAMRWASQYRKDLYHHLRYNKRLRIRRKYSVRIIQEYKNMMRGKKNA